MNSKKEMRLKRDSELLDLFQEALMAFIGHNTKDPRKKTLEFALANGHPHYYVSHSRAYPVVCSIIRRGVNPVKMPDQSQMWDEIAAKVRQAMDSGVPSINKALEFVLQNCRASRFFISYPYARRHTYVACKERSRAVKRTFKVRNPVADSAFGAV